MGEGRRAALRRCASALARVLLFWLATMALLAIAGPFAGSGSRAALIVGALTVPPTFALTMLFIRWDRRRLRDYGFGLSGGSGLRFAGGLLVGFALVAAQTALMLLGGGVRWAPVSPAPAMLLPVLGYLLLATREELAFRGYPLRKLASDMDPWSAQIVVAILFVIEHRLGGSSWTNALVGSGMGALVFGMAALASRGLAFPIGLHAAWNMGDWARGTKSGDGLWHMVLEPGARGHADRIAMGSYVVVMALAFVGLWQWYRRSRPFPNSPA
jgi:hypothetical protein